MARLTFEDLYPPLLQLIVAHLNPKPEEARTITPETSMVNDLHADSLDLVELIMDGEEATGVHIPDKDAEQMLNIGDYVRYLVEHQVDETPAKLAEYQAAKAKDLREARKVLGLDEDTAEADAPAAA